MGVLWYPKKRLSPLPSEHPTMHSAKMGKLTVVINTIFQRNTRNIRWRERIHPQSWGNGINTYPKTTPSVFRQA